MISNLFFAMCARGTEEALFKELSRLGVENLKIENAGCTFTGDLKTLYLTNFKLHTPTRILVQMKEFSAMNPEMLYAQVRRVAWEEILSVETTFSVDVTISKRNLFGTITHSNFAALKIKDAIVDRMRKEKGDRPNVDTQNPDVKINAYFYEGRCQLSLDSSGDSLHLRGYRTEYGDAPLKETLASSILELTGWEPSLPLVDPMCGSGTFLIEAALKKTGIAPQTLRKRFGFQTWNNFDRLLWNEVVASSGVLGEKPEIPQFYGFDHDSKVLINAKENARRAGVSSLIELKRQPIEKLEPPTTTPGIVLVNPPYGARIGAAQGELELAYKTLGDVLKHRFKGWKAFIFTGSPELSKHIGLKTSRRHPLFNGPLECRLLEYTLY